jgi:hypothetical protein
MEWKKISLITKYYELKNIFNFILIKYIIHV